MYPVHIVRLLLCVCIVLPDNPQIKPPNTACTSCLLSLALGTRPLAVAVVLDKHGLTAEN